MRIWVEETKQILTKMWERQTVLEIAEAVNLWHENDTNAKGKNMQLVTTDAGVQISMDGKGRALDYYALWV